MTPPRRLSSLLPAPLNDLAPSAALTAPIGLASLPDAGERAIRIIQKTSHGVFPGELFGRRRHLVGPLEERRSANVVCLAQQGALAGADARAGVLAPQNVQDAANSQKLGPERLRSFDQVRKGVL